ncbi:MAG TPA: S8 family serine peptidase, partial [Candidatus Polarisedimenticolia bacterium]|nr:S8 family serine peptidase [Candidatus Polarisedimenticolia bacterium]
MTRRDGRALLWLPVLLLVPGALLFGDRPRPSRHGEAEGPERAIASSLARVAERLRPAEPARPPPEFAALGHALAPRVLQGEAAHGFLLTNLGHVEWDPERDAIASGMPAELRTPPEELSRVATGSLQRGLNYLRLSEAAIAARGHDTVASELQRHARILGWLPDRTVIAFVEAHDREALARSTLVDRSRPLEAYHKISPRLGRLPRWSRAEAENPDLLARVALVPGLGGTGLLEELARLSGVSEVIPDAASEEGAQLRVRYDRIATLARRAEVLSIEPVFDYLLANAENVPAVQAGSAEDTDFARPFDAAGVDGGGIDTNGDGRRVNDGSDLVPPQLVTVTDNGISVDTPSFSQTATQVTTAGIPLGVLHRKIHAIQNVTDSGNSCDAPLSGSGTHGHVVASIIAASSSVFGIYGNRSGIGGPSEPRNVNLDGVARGARIIVQDAGVPNACLLGTKVEPGGNTPGNLLDRLTLAICPANGSGTGACAGVVGGGGDAHLSILPFGVPNFSDLDPEVVLEMGTYSLASSQIDRFLYNNRDYMVFAPSGNSGADPGQLRFGLGDRRIPDLFDGEVIGVPEDYEATQVQPPATAKNLVAVGASGGDCFTAYGTFDCEGALAGFSSRGPATEPSLRMAPMLTAPGVDLAAGLFTNGITMFRSSDNDNNNPVEAQLDEANAGTSFSAAFLTGAAAIVRDYFAQGFYPTGSRGPATDRMPGISGALVKASLAASADFSEDNIGTTGEHDAGDHTLRRTRCIDLTPLNGAEVGVMCNSEQGYGRPVLTSVLPLANWSDDFVLHPSSLRPREYPAAGLLVFDRWGTGEGVIDNGASVSRSHLFTVFGPKTVPTPSGGLAIAAAQLRLALAWIDLPSPENS